MSNFLEIIFVIKYMQKSHDVSTSPRPFLSASFYSLLVLEKTSERSKCRDFLACIFITELKSFCFKYKLKYLLSTSNYKTNQGPFCVQVNNPCNLLVRKTACECLWELEMSYPVRQGSYNHACLLLLKANIVLLGKFVF